MDLSATDSSAMAWRGTQQRRIAAESTEEREARLHQLSVTQRQRIAAESTEEREARLKQLRILPNRNNHEDLLINCHSKYIPILLVLMDVSIIEAFVMLLPQIILLRNVLTRFTDKLHVAGYLVRLIISEMIF